MRLVYVLIGTLVLLPGVAAHDLTSGWTSYLLGDGRLSSGTQAGPSGTTPVVAWDAAFDVTSSPVWASPIVANGAVYFGLQEAVSGAGQGWIRSYDLKNGDLRWETRLQNHIGATPAVDGGTLYLVANDLQGRLHALDTSNGNSKWDVVLDSQHSQSSPLVSNGTVFLASQAGTVIAVDAATHAVRWQAGDSGATPNENSVAVWDGLVFLSTVAGPRQGSGSNDFVYAFDRATGAVRWRVDPTDPSSTDDDLITTPVAVDGRVYVASAAVKAFTSGQVNHPAIPGRLFALDTATGSVLWKKELASTNWREPTVVDGLLVVSDSSGTVHVLDAKTGAESCGRCWSKPFGDVITTPVAVSRDTLYFGGYDLAPCAGSLYAASLAGGAQQWKVDLGSRIPTESLAVAQGFIALAAQTLAVGQCAPNPSVELVVVGSDPGPHAPNAAPSLTDFVPTNGLASVAPGGTLRWTGKDADAGDGLRYDVYFGAAKPPPLVARLQSGDQFAPTLTRGQTYHWQVVVVDSHGARVEGPALSFSTAGTQSPTPSTTSKGATTTSSAPAPEASKDSLPGPSTILVAAALAAAIILRRR